MKDNIVDFNSRRAIKSTAGNSKQVFNSLTEFLTSLPQNALMADVAERFAEQIGRLVLYATIVAKVSELIESAGLDPDHFELDEDSYDRFMDLEIDERDEKEFMSTVDDETLDSRENIWNGPWFDWEDHSNGKDTLHDDNLLLSFSSGFDLFKPDNFPKVRISHYVSPSPPH